MLLNILEFDQLSNHEGSLRKKQDKNFKLFFSVKNGIPTC